MTSEQHGFIHAPRDRLLHHSRRDRTNSMVLSASFCPSIAPSTSCSFKLICSPPGFAVLNHHAFPGLFPATSFRQLTTPHALPSERVISSSIARPSVLRVSTSLKIQARSTRCTLEFWLSVRHDVNLHDVPNLSSISIAVLDLSFP